MKIELTDYTEKIFLECKETVQQFELYASKHLDVPILQHDDEGVIRLALAFYTDKLKSILEK